MSCSTRVTALPPPESCVTPDSELDAWLHQVLAPRPHKEVAAISAAFAKESIVLADVVLLTNDDLKELKIKMGPRKRLLAAIASSTAASSVANAEAHPVVDPSTTPRSPLPPETVSIHYVVTATKHATIGVPAPLTSHQAKQLESHSSGEDALGVVVGSSSTPLSPLPPETVSIHNVVAATKHATIGVPAPLTSQAKQPESHSSGAEELEVVDGVVDCSPSPGLTQHDLAFVQNESSLAEWSAKWGPEVALVLPQADEVERSSILSMLTPEEHVEEVIDQRALRLFWRLPSRKHKLVLLQRWVRRMYPLASTYRVICGLQPDGSSFPPRADSLWSRVGFRMFDAPDSFWAKPPHLRLFRAEVLATGEEIPVFGSVLYTHRDFINQDDECGEFGAPADWVLEWRERGGPPPDGVYFRHLAEDSLLVDDVSEASDASSEGWSALGGAEGWDEPSLGSYEWDAAGEVERLAPCAF